MAKEANSSLSQRTVFLSGQPRSLQLAGQHAVEGYYRCLHSHGGTKFTPGGPPAVLQ